jgi:hypothetical protein
VNFNGKFIFLVLLAKHHKYEDVSLPSYKTIFVFNIATVISKYSRNNMQHTEEFQVRYFFINYLLFETNWHMKWHVLTASIV